MNRTITIFSHASQRGEASTGMEALDNSIDLMDKHHSTAEKK